MCEIARVQDDRSNEIGFRYALEAEKIHAKLFREVKKYVDGENG